MIGTANSSVRIIRSVELEQIKFVWRSDNILHYATKENSFITMKDVDAVMEIVKTWGEENKYLHLYESGINSSVDTDVREWGSSSSQNQHTVADAILVKNMAQRLVGNFYVQFNRPVKPTRLFSSRADAIQWLLQQGGEYAAKHPEWLQQTTI